jgi:hypothetical protein
MLTEKLDLRVLFPNLTWPIEDDNNSIKEGEIINIQDLLPNLVIEQEQQVVKALPRPSRPVARRQAQHQRVIDLAGPPFPQAPSRTPSTASTISEEFFPIPKSPYKNKGVTWYSPDVVNACQSDHFFTFFLNFLNRYRYNFKTQLKHVDGYGKELEDFFRRHANEHFVLGKARNEWDDNRLKKEWCDMTGCVKPDSKGFYNMSN